MSIHSFYNQLQIRWAHKKYVCVGLDIDAQKLPTSILPEAHEIERIQTFLIQIIHATHESACAFKLNSAHFEKHGSKGIDLLSKIIIYIHKEFPDIPVIIDAKRGDIADTNQFYADAIFNELGADAVTVHPYMGKKSLWPFLMRADKGVIVMGANSAEGAQEFQDLRVGEKNEPLYKYTCRQVAEKWNENKNCAVTASAKHPEKLKEIRSVVGEMPILLLGIGAQGGSLAECIRSGAARNSFGLIINSSRAILYASSGDDFAIASRNAALELNRAIVKLLK